MSAISQLLLARFWPNFKGRFLRPSWTYSNCHGDICPGNICHGDICPCQEYLSCYWSDFDQTLKVDSWDHLELIPTVMSTFVQAIFVLVTFVHIRNISAVTDPIFTKLQKYVPGTIFNRWQLSQWYCPVLFSSQHQDHFKDKFMDHFNSRQLSSTQLGTTLLKSCL